MLTQLLTIQSQAAQMLTWIFAVSGLLLAYHYVVYPIVIGICARLFGICSQPRALELEELPSVTLLIAAYNEASVIRERILNALALDYPKDRLQILIASDGSVDQTASIASEFTSQKVEVLAFPENRGKSVVLEDAVRSASGEILVLSDANTMMRPDAIRQLVRWFDDDRIGVVSGCLKLVDSKTGTNCDGTYWKYENFLKRCEGRLEALLGASGAIYAMRAKVRQPLPPDTLVDDFTWPLLARLATKHRIVYDPTAIAIEETAPDLGSEFRRRARIGAGGYQALTRLWRLLSPSYGWTAFAFFSHKVMRWLSPFLLIALLLSSLFLSRHPLFATMSLLQLIFYSTATVGSLTSASGPKSRVVRLPALFVGVNLALLVGFVRWLRSDTNGKWAPTSRSNANLDMAGVS